MTNRTSSVDDANAERLRREALLIEYQMCQSEANEASRRFWTTLNIFTPAVLVALALVLQIDAGVEAVVVSCGTAFVVIVGAFTIRAHLDHDQFLRVVMFARQRQIEELLDLYKGRVHNWLSSHRRLADAVAVAPPEMEPTVRRLWNQPGRARPRLGRFQLFKVNWLVWPVVLASIGVLGTHVYWWIGL